MFLLLVLIGYWFWVGCIVWEWMRCDYVDVDWVCGVSVWCLLGSVCLEIVVGVVGFLFMVWVGCWYGWNGGVRVLLYGCFCVIGLCWLMYWVVYVVFLLCCNVCVGLVWRMCWCWFWIICCGCLDFLLVGSDRLVGCDFVYLVWFSVIIVFWVYCWIWYYYWGVVSCW